jgi:sigma-B regulation protein RsbU (phosphoserine phosphatase)
MIDKDRLCFVIADVSDKGIGAALFMMQSKSLIKSFALTGLPVDEVFFKANNVLCENNGANMFVTAFIGILDLSTGVLDYCNAGHNHPLIKRAQGSYEPLNSKRGFVLAGMPDMPYSKTQTMLKANDKLFLYTDGVTEAMNRESQLYGETRMTDYLNSLESGKSLSDMITAVKADVDRFADGAEQADDITMLVVAYEGTQKPA